MMMLGYLLFITALAFAAYAYMAHYKNTDPGQPALKRVKAAVIAAAMAIGGAVTSQVSQWLGQ